MPAEAEAEVPAEVPVVAGVGVLSAFRVVPVPQARFLRVRRMTDRILCPLFPRFPRRSSDRILP